MNCVLVSKTTGLELDSYDVRSASLLDTPIDDSYATAPIAVVLPVDHHYEEEELHTSFEQAISGRVSAMQVQLSRLSAQHPVASRAYGHRTTTEPLDVSPTSTRLHRASLFAGLHQRYTVLVALALTFAMLGFDLMGLLVLHMH